MEISSQLYLLSFNIKIFEDYLLAYGFCFFLIVSYLSKSFMGTLANLILNGGLV